MMNRATRGSLGVFLGMQRAVSPKSYGGGGEERQIPELDWEERSDWINVKTDVIPAAVGDGVANDTAAIQAAFDMITPARGGPKTVYLPVGTYRITETLELPSAGSGIWGGLIVGHGRTTRLLWDGAVGGRMLWTKGATYTRYTGLVWDGNGKAAVGVDHASKRVYETHIRHRHEQFMNFSGEGIRTGNHRGVATAEVHYENCLFMNCGEGISILWFNCYDNTIDGCEFYNCNIGINCLVGNMYVRNCHFENSSEMDIFVSVRIHGKSIRRCTSVGSRMFLSDNYMGPTVHANPLTLQDCHVSGWTNPDGAIVTGYRGPLTIFDGVFTNPPTDRPPIRLANSSYSEQLLVTSNCRTETSALVDPGPSSRITDIPPGQRTGNLESAQQRFLKDKVRIPGKVFDAKRDFGAVGNAVADDTEAIKATIAAARNHGQDAIAYLPFGIYKVTSTIEVTGSNYFIGGAGYSGSAILLDSTAPGSVLFHVHDPQQVRMEDLEMRLGWENVTKILQTGSDGNSSMVYDGIYGPFYSKHEPGFRFVDLPQGTVVQVLEAHSSMQVSNCSRATILINLLYLAECSVTVEGTEPVRDGFFGALSSSTSYGNPYVLYVKDNQNVVWTDFYIEMSDRFLKLTGSPVLPAGRVTMHGVKTDSDEHEPITIDNYKGSFFHSGSDVYRYQFDTGVIIKQIGATPVDILLLGEMFRVEAPTLDFDTGGRPILVENLVVDEVNMKYSIPNRIPDDGLEKVADALDDFRRLGKMDLDLNYHLSGTPETYSVSYAAGSHCVIQGLANQTVLAGGNAEQVTAIADAGYHFVAWSDGETSNPRQDMHVSHNIEVTANFSLDAGHVEYYSFTSNGGADRTVKNKGGFQWAGAEDLRIGGGHSFRGRNVFGAAVLSFPLPDWPAGQRLVSAELHFSVLKITSKVQGNVDLYGLPYRNSEKVLSSDFYQGVYGGDSTGAMPIQDDVLTVGSSVGDTELSSHGKQHLANYIRTQIQSGASEGDTIFLRFSPDSLTDMGWAYYAILCSRATDPAQRPRLVLGFESTKSVQ